MDAADGALVRLLAQLLRALVAHAHVAARQDGRVALVDKADDAKAVLVLLLRQVLPRRVALLQPVDVLSSRECCRTMLLNFTGPMFKHRLKDSQLIDSRSVCKLRDVLQEFTT